MKPNWDKAPTWARYLAMDCDSTWWWFENKPELKKGYWIDDWLNLKGQCKLASPEWNSDFKSTLQERPSE